MACRFSVSPVNWNNTDIEEWGGRTPFAELLREAGELGFDGVENGWDFPADANLLRRRLQEAGLLFTGAFAWVPFSDAGAYEAALPDLLAFARWLREAGADRFVAAEQWTPERRRAAGVVTEREQLGADRRGALARNAEDLARRIQPLGLKLAVHNHMGCFVETDDEIRGLLDRTSPELVAFCLDTAHALWGGADPAALADRYADRIAYMHAKDVDPERMRAARARRTGFLGGLKLGVFCPAGEGCIPFADVFRPLSRLEWVIVESERDPDAWSGRQLSAAGLAGVRAALGGL